MSENKDKVFSEDDRDTLYSVMQLRRDMRHFLTNAIVDEDVLKRILEAAHSAPSVGLMQPWRFIRIKNPILRENIAALVDDERQRTALELDERKKEFLNLKVEGVRECAELLAVVTAPDDGTVFGRRSMPEEMALCSTACAIQNMWLAARAENIGMGWVSLFEPKQLADALQCPEGAKPIALLCIGPVKSFYDKPMLEAVGWRKARPLEDLLSEDHYFFEENK